MQSRYTNAVLTIIALCLLWISVKDFIITKHITRTQLETLLEASTPLGAEDHLRVHGQPAMFTVPVRGSSDEPIPVDIREPLEVYGIEPIPVKIEDVDFGVSMHTYR